MGAVDGGDRLLAATQTALLKQAREEGRAAEEALRDKRRELELVTASREQVGVELYNAQQQLQRIAQQLEAADQERMGAVTQRNAAEQGLSHLTRQHAELIQDAQSSRRAAAQLQADLDKATQTLRGAEASASASQSSAGVAARTAQQTDKLAASASGAKRAQDALLMSLARELEAAHAAQLDAQGTLEGHRQSRDVTMAALQRVNADLAAAQATKTELLAAWSRAVADAGRADYALNACRTALNAMQDARLEMAAQLRGAQCEAAQEAHDAKTSSAQLAAAQEGHEQLNAQLEELSRRMLAAAAEQSRLEAALAAAQKDADTGAAKRAALESELTALETEIKTTVSAVAAVDGDMLRALADSCIAERGAHKLVASITAVRQQQADCAMLMVSSQQEAARSRGHRQRSQAYVDEASTSLAAADEELARLDGAVATAEAGLKRTRDSTERAARETEKLDRRLDALLAGRTATDLGPLEATVANLAKAVATVTMESREHQRTWIGLQSQLLSLARDASSCEADARTLRGQRGVLQGKAQRLTASAEAAAAEVNQVERSMAAGHLECLRLADAVAQAQRQAAQLDEDVAAAEAAFHRALDEDESTSDGLEAKVKQLGEELVAAEVARTAAEADVARWEAQVACERDTQQALDPTAGGAPLVELRREIHRLELRRSEAVKRAAALNAELGRAVMRRDTLQLKAQGAAAAAASGKRNFLADTQLRDAQSECAATSARIMELRAAAAALEPEAEAARRALGDAHAASEQQKGKLDALVSDNVVSRATLAAVCTAMRVMDDHATAAGRVNTAALPEDAAAVEAAVDNLRVAATALGQAHGEAVASDVAAVHAILDIKI